MNYIVHELYSDTCKRTKSWKCKVRHLRFCTILSALLEAPECPTYNKCSSWQVMVFVRGFPYLQLKRFLCLYLSSYPPISLRVKGMATHWGTYPGLCEEFCHGPSTPEPKPFNCPRFYHFPIPKRSSLQKHFFPNFPYYLPFILFSFYEFLTLFPFLFQNPKVSLPSLKDSFL